MGGDLRERLIVAEEAIYAAADDPMVNWDVEDLQGAFAAAGLEVSLALETETSQMRVTSALLARWFALDQEGKRPTYAQHLLETLSLEELAAVRQSFEQQLLNQTATWQTRVAFISATKAT